MMADLRQPRLRRGTSRGRVRFLPVLVLGLLVAGCGGGAEEPTDGGGETTTGGGDTAGTEVTIENFAFDPGTLTIEVGDTVTWTNNDSAPHTATADDDTFDSGSLAQGDTFSHTFEEAGTFPYVCTFHPNMVGEIVVE
jgi:plastocyanin